MKKSAGWAFTHKLHRSNISAVLKIFRLVLKLAEVNGSFCRTDLVLLSTQHVLLYIMRDKGIFNRIHISVDSLIGCFFFYLAAVMFLDL